MAQITLSHVSKMFEDTEALKDINLEIEQGDIFGIIGMSGAGKSTLVRCLNFLERPTAGEVEIEGEKLSMLSEKELRKKRQNIAMIFQHFNLLMQKSVLDNVAFPLRIQGIRKKEAKEQARQYLKEVGLQDKERSYPSKLSGGQKQRVAIARALASKPHILLCDEATSALDPQTTQSILDLLRDINKKYGITIVVITHQMEVIQKICNRVAIIEAGELAEEGKVEEIFRQPRSEAGKRLILRQEYSERCCEELLHLSNGKKLRIVYESNSTYEPVIANMVLQIQAPINILRADTRDVQGIAKGEMIIEVQNEHYDVVRQYLTGRNISVWEV